MNTVALPDLPRKQKTTQAVATTTTLTDTQMIIVVVVVVAVSSERLPVGMFAEKKIKYFGYGYLFKSSHLN